MWNGMMAPMRLEGRPYTDGTGLRFRILSASAAGLPVPSVLWPKMEQPIDKVLAEQLGKSGAVREVDLTAGRLIVVLDKSM